MPNLIPFDILKKTELPDSLLKHGAYNEDSKFLKKQKMLVFRQPITRGDEHYFQYVPNLLELHFAAGFDDAETLKTILQFPFPKLNSLLLGKWNTPPLDALKEITSLRSLEIESLINQDFITLGNEFVETLTLHLQFQNKRIDLSGFSKLKTFFISGSLPSSILLPESVEEVQVGYLGLLMNYMRVPEAVPFNTNSLSECKSVSKLKLASELSDDSNTVLPFIKELRYDGENPDRVPSLFPGLQTFHMGGLDNGQLSKLLSESPLLTALRVYNTSATEDEITALQNAFPAVAIRATTPTGEAFTERYFENGKWNEEVTR